jgi:uncharacterized paraquat-inducible protein A
MSQKTWKARQQWEKGQGAEATVETCPACTSAVDAEAETCSQCGADLNYYRQQKEPAALAPTGSEPTAPANTEEASG